MVGRMIFLRIGHVLRSALQPVLANHDGPLLARGGSWAIAGCHRQRRRERRPAALRSRSTSAGRRARACGLRGQRLVEAADHLVVEMLAVVAWFPASAGERDWRSAFFQNSARVRSPAASSNCVSAAIWSNWRFCRPAGSKSLRKCVGEPPGEANLARRQSVQKAGQGHIARRRARAGRFGHQFEPGRRHQSGHQLPGPLQLGLDAGQLRRGNFPGAALAAWPCWAAGGPSICGVRQASTTSPGAESSLPARRRRTARRGPARCDRSAPARRRLGRRSSR